jgi:hypothetical protein
MPLRNKSRSRPSCQEFAATNKAPRVGCKWHTGGGGASLNAQRASPWVLVCGSKVLTAAAITRVCFLGGRASYITPGGVKKNFVSSTHKKVVDGWEPPPVLRETKSQVHRHVPTCYGTAVPYLRAASNNMAALPVWKSFKK